MYLLCRFFSCSSSSLKQPHSFSKKPSLFPSFKQLASLLCITSVNSKLGVMEDVQRWSFLSTPKIRMQNCEKCSQEFCSTINYRRHMRLHRRNLNADKDSTTINREVLQGFWDKLSVEESMGILSFEDVFLEGVVGSSLLNELEELILQSRCCFLPESYVKAGITLLEIVQGRPSRFLIPSRELFRILDEASEKTFLCTGTSGPLLKYVFAGDAGKIGHEMRNLVACTSFLVEKKMVTACLADKDAEALRYQKLLVEEEDNAQRRQADILEKKRLKKLRQKEQRGKEQGSVVPGDSPETRPIPSSVDAAETIREITEISHNTTSARVVQIVNLENIEKDHEDRYPDFSTCQTVERRPFFNYHLQAPRMQRGTNSFHNYQARLTHKHASNGEKVWAPKSKIGIINGSHDIIQSQIQAENSPNEDRKRELLIGSISVTLVETNTHKNPDKNELVKLRRQVNQHEVKDNSVVQLAGPEDSHPSHVAEAFLAKRWKETIASDHVNLALFHEAEPPEVDNQEAVPSSNLDQCSSLLSSTENLLTTLESSGVIQSKFGANIDKGSKVGFVKTSSISNQKEVAKSLTMPSLPSFFFNVMD